MRKLIVSEFITLNGVMEDPGGAEGFKSGGWSLDYYNEEYGKYKLDEIFETGALLLGRVTYEGFAAAWPNYQDEDGFADRMNSMPKYVVSKTLTSADWNNTTIISDNIAEEITRLKAQPGQNIMIAGSAQLVNSLSELGLIDEYRLMVHPVILSGGKPLSTQVTNNIKLKLTQVKTLETGIVVLHYERA